MVFIALSPLILAAIFSVTMCILLMFFDIDPFEIHGDMNRLYKCRKCDLVHRRYQRLLTLKENDCPHCNTENYTFSSVSNYSEEGKYNHPFAPKISIFRAFKLDRVVKNNKKNEYMDKQIEKYLKVQETQLMKMKDKKDELVKSGVFDK